MVYLLSIKLSSISFVVHTIIGVTDLLMAPSKHPGCSGTRNLHDNLSDLRAQVAANQKVKFMVTRLHCVYNGWTILFYPLSFLQGINLVSELIDAYGLNVVQAYMKYIQVQLMHVWCVNMRMCQCNIIGDILLYILNWKLLGGFGNPTSCIGIHVP